MFFAQLKKIKIFIGFSHGRKTFLLNRLLKYENPEITQYNQDYWRKFLRDAIKTIRLRYARLDLMQRLSVY